MAGGRGRGGIHCRGWFHRRQHHRSPAHTTDTADTTDAAPDVALPDSGNEAGGTSDETAPPASFDQVLRRAAEARNAEREPDD